MGDISGKWNEVMEIQRKNVRPSFLYSSSQLLMSLERSGEREGSVVRRRKRRSYYAESRHSRGSTTTQRISSVRLHLSLPFLHPLIKLRRLWSAVTDAIKGKDHEAATDAKTAVEDAARDSSKVREESGESFSPRYFALRNGEFRLKFTLVPFPFHSLLSGSRVW